MMKLGIIGAVGAFLWVILHPSGARQAVAAQAQAMSAMEKIFPPPPVLVLTDPATWIVEAHDYLEQS